MDRSHIHSISVEYADNSAGHKSLFLCHKGNKVMLQAGTSDDVEVYREEGSFHVLTLNSGLGYLGLEVFQEGTLEAQGEVFIQNSDELQMSKDPFEYSPHYLIRTLQEYLD